MSGREEMLAAAADAIEAARAAEHAAWRVLKLCQAQSDAGPTTPTDPRLDLGFVQAMCTTRVRLHAAYGIISRLVGSTAILASAAGLGADYQRQVGDAAERGIAAATEDCPCPACVEAREVAEASIDRSTVAAKAGAA